MTEKLQEDMGRCSVTGKLYPADELITLHGNVVGAEGKALLVERLKTGEDITPRSPPRITIGKRFGAAIVDVILFVLGVRIFINVVDSQRPEIVSSIAALAFLVYLAEMHARYGWTLGKLSSGIRVVNIDGSRIAWKTAYLRTLALGWPLLFVFASFLTHDPTLVRASASLAFLWFGVSGAFVLLDTDARRSLHDRMAGTRITWRGGIGRADS